jgi:hypothetical protein
MSTATYENFPWYTDVRAIYAQGGDPEGLSADIEYYQRFGWAFICESFILLGERIGQGWYVRLAAGRGSIKDFVELMPYPLPWIAWQRPGRGRAIAKWHLAETVKRIVSYDRDKQQDGSSSMLPEGRRCSEATSSPETSVTDNSGGQHPEPRDGCSEPKSSGISINNTERTSGSGQRPTVTAGGIN